jgi:hypothetical protein
MMAMKSSVESGPTEIRKHEPDSESMSNGTSFIKELGAASRETKGVPGWIFEYGSPPFNSRGF